MTHIEADSFINIIYKKPENINRRIKVKNMTEEINRLDHFKQYNLPEIVNADPEKLEILERIFSSKMYIRK